MDLGSLFRRLTRAAGPQARPGGRKRGNLGPYSRLVDRIRARRGGRR